jgi:DNA-binding GntR family transcriptional regulator
MITRMPTPAQEESAAERTYRWLRTRILDGTVPGGQMLSEGEVANALGLSRTPVREAFLQLSAEGMLELYPKRGALVLTVTAAQLREVLVARALIEPWAVRAVASQSDRSAVTVALRKLTEQGRRALAKRDGASFAETDRSFHQQLLIAAGNGLLAEFYASLRDRGLRGGMLAIYNDTVRGETAMDQHGAIADAIERGDHEQGAAAMLEHLNATASALGFAELS